MSESLQPALEGCVGDVLEAAREGRDPVNVPMIRNFCDAVGDTDPVYLDDAAARATGLPGIVAPPGMLRTWTMLPPDEQMQPEPAASGVYALLAQAGFDAKAATNCDLDFRRYLRPGDVVRASTQLVGVSTQKHTALGDGHFVDTVTTYTDGEGDPVAEMRWRSLRYRPGSARPRNAPRADPAADGAAAPAGGGNTPGPWQIAITPTLVIGGAMASRDYQDVHHDAELARRRGMPDIFMNMMTTSGLVSRFVTDWTGPCGRVLKIAQSLGVPNHPGDTLTLSVTGVARDPAGETTALSIVGRNGLGRHVQAEVVVTT